MLLVVNKEFIYRYNTLSLGHPRALAGATA
jgi:hypothetical protein